jgi:hypothetical protein
VYRLYFWKEGAMGGSTNKAERLVAVFLLGVMLFNYPLLAVFNRAVEVMGIPLVYVYIVTAWGLLIAILALIVERP